MRRAWGSNRRIRPKERRGSAKLVVASWTHLCLASSRTRRKTREEGQAYLTGRFLGIRRRWRCTSTAGAGFRCTVWVCPSKVSMPPTHDDAHRRLDSCLGAWLRYRAARVTPGGWHQSRQACSEPLPLGWLHEVEAWSNYGMLGLASLCSKSSGPLSSGPSHPLTVGALPHVPTLVVFNNVLKFQFPWIRVEGKNNNRRARRLKGPP